MMFSVITVVLGDKYTCFVENMNPDYTKINMTKIGRNPMQKPAYI